MTAPSTSSLTPLGSRREAPSRAGCGEQPSLHHVRDAAEIEPGVIPGDPRIGIFRSGQLDTGTMSGDLTIAHC